MVYLRLLILVRFAGILVTLVLINLVACSKPAPLIVDDVAIADETQDENWLAYGRTHNEWRFSPLKQINTSNVNDLKVDWYLDLPNDQGLVSTPLVVNGVLYFTGTMNVVRAVNAATGELLWEYDPKVAEQVADRRQIGWVHNRGISFWKGKVLLATWDGRLIAVDASAGKELWSTQTFDPEKPLYITGAPKAFKGKVLIGNGGTEIGAARGYVTAYDAETGEQAWRFYIVPGNPADGFENDAMAMAAETWTGEWWKVGGGGNTWHGYTYDAELDVLYLGTGNGSPWNRKIRSPEGGDNLFLCSIVALDPDTGEYLWHYQTTPGEAWDYNSCMDIILADLTIDGQEVKALLHAPKNGFFYVINRETGKLISAKPFTETTWATEIDLSTGRPVEVSGARYETEPALIKPSAWGGHSWHSMSFNPVTGYVYLPTIHLAATYSDAGIDLDTWSSPDGWVDVGVHLTAAQLETTEGRGSLQAWDPVGQEAVWEIKQPGFWNGGTLTTAGNLVFQGQATGDFVAYHAQNGEVCWKVNVGLGISAPPITYAVGGRQYVALLVGWGGGAAGLGGPQVASHGWAYGVHPRRLIAFSLQGDKELPESPPPVVPEPIAAPGFEVDKGLAVAGAMEYETVCRGCHGPAAVAAGMAPDLRASLLVLAEDSFEEATRQGALTERGMPAFRELTDFQLSAIRHYIRFQAARTLGTTQNELLGLGR